MTTFSAEEINFLGLWQRALWRKRATVIFKTPGYGLINHFISAFYYNN